jgi:hypothetical protein
VYHTSTPCPLKSFTLLHRVGEPWPDDTETFASKITTKRNLALVFIRELLTSTEFSTHNPGYL